jgi:hypothetical protein
LSRLRAPIFVEVVQIIVWQLNAIITLHIRIKKSLRQIASGLEIPETLVPINGGHYFRLHCVYPEIPFPHLRIMKFIVLLIIPL